MANTAYELSRSDPLYPSARDATPIRPTWQHRRFRLTRDGKFFIGIVFGVGLAAIGTGNNLLYLIFGMLLSLILVSWVLSETSLRHLTVVRRLPFRAQVGKPHLVEIEVFNHKQRFPSYAIEIEDYRQGQPSDKRCFFLKIGPQSTQVAAYRRTPARRGRDVHAGFRIATRFPFGLFEKSLDIAASAELLIYPAVDTVPPRGYSGSSAENGTNHHLVKGRSDEFLALREMREGDDPRDIYWRKTAAQGKFIVRDRARTLDSRVSLVLDNLHPDAAASETWSTHFEQRIRQMASLSVAHIKRGDTVHLRTTYGENSSGSPAVGVDPVLRFLALVSAHPNQTRPSNLPRTPSDRMPSSGTQPLISKLPKPRQQS